VSNKAGRAGPSRACCWEVWWGAVGVVEGLAVAVFVLAIQKFPHNKSGLRAFAVSWKPLVGVHNVYERVQSIIYIPIICLQAPSSGAVLRFKSVVEGLNIVHPNIGMMVLSILHMCKAYKIGANFGVAFNVNSH
jgi:hypothetical protein